MSRFCSEFPFWGPCQGAAVVLAGLVAYSERMLC